MLEINNDFPLMEEKSFALLHNFENYSDIELVKNEIRKQFSNMDSFLGITQLTSVAKIPIIIMSFSNITDRDTIHDTIKGNLHVKFFR